MAKQNGTLSGIERTGAQKPRNAAYGVSGMPWVTAADPGTYETYRAMDSHPTVAMAKAAALAPVKAAQLAYEEQEGAPAGALELIQETIDELRPVIIKDGLRAVGYGWQPFEVVWHERGGAVVPRKLKPLLPDITEPLIDESTGVYCGLRQGKVTIPAPSTFVLTHDSEAGNIFGRSRHENIREWAWTPWKHLSQRLQVYTTKVAGIIMQLHYTPGGGTDENGAEVENHVIANRLLRKTAEGGSVAIPMQLAPWADQALKAGVNIADLMAWRFSFLEAGTPHHAQMIESMRYHDSLLMRGWLVPERVALEGQHGTLAEAVAHADVALSVAQETLDWLLGEVNRSLVDPILVRNFGRAARGSVRVTAAPLASEVRAWLRDLLKQVLVQPGNVDLLMTWLDVDSVFDQAGVPKAADTIEPVERAPEPGALPPDLAASLAGMYRRINGKRRGRSA